ncbi:MAG: ATP-binding protein [Solirubrobacteraceae bacterium]|nr:ATP-binding protein [Solirubrobacteraceae bacterium]
MEFLNRTDDLAALEDQWDADGGRFFIVWGRRRVGKTELLSRFADGRRSLFFEATDTTERAQLQALSTELAAAGDNRLLHEQPVTTWSGALAAIEQFVAGRERTVVVLDEFQYLARRQPELATLLSTWWRTTGRSLPLLLVIAGSEVSFFRDDVLAGQLYGRRDGQLQVRPFDAASAALFTPGYSAEDKVRTFAVCGGMPYYLTTFSDGVPIAENILRNVLYRDGLLHEEAELLLRQELPDPRRHFGVLAAIAGGDDRNSTIATRTGLSSSEVRQTLAVLERLQLVEQLRPVTASVRSKKTTYAIADGFLGFHFRFVEPYRSRLRTRDDARRHLEQTVLPALDAFVSKPTWERLCQAYVREREPDAVAVGAWWGTVRTAPRRSEQREVDVVAVDAAGSVIALGSCKWTNVPMGFDEERLLTALSPAIPGFADDARRYYCSRSGFTPALHDLAASQPERVRLVTPDDLYPA